MEFEKVFSERYAIGEWAESRNSQIPLGTQHIYLEDDKPSGFMEIGVDALQASRVDLKIKENSIGTKKRTLPSSSKGSAVRKKNKVSFIDRTLCEYIVMMANIVTQIADAIQSTTRVSQERKIFTEFMTELTSIPNFFERE
ncbi:hypothetical protein M5K25_016023 [Dendrobium thyrsiflorum]|uniref:Uncharacterized protein n=1 Tax=Dendrobium thyrsiflorum TaxID=117978 RepID=A0ABD0USL7_DENTH